MSLDPAKLMSAAALAHREGRLEEAASLVSRVLEIAPDDLSALMLAGVVAAKRGRSAEAIPLLSRVSQNDPNSYHALYWLSIAQLREGETAPAVIAAEKAVAINGKDPQLLHHLGLCYLEGERWEGALASFQSAAKAAPHIGAIQLNLGIVLEELGRQAEARKAYRRSAVLSPGQVDALYRLGQSFAHALEFAPAETIGNQILGINPQASEGHLLLAVAMVGLNRPEEAGRHAELALHAESNAPVALAFVAKIFQSLGRGQEAVDLLRQSIQRDPLYGPAYYALAHAQAFHAADLLLLEKMEQVALDPKLPRRSKADVEFAMGKANADLGRYQVAMDHYNQANRIERERHTGGRPFDKEFYAEAMDFAIHRLNRAFIQDNLQFGSPNELPVFVVGMMRSGTTLAEQILSSHHNVGAAGELRFWMDNRGAAMSHDRLRVDAARLDELTCSYLAMLNAIAPGKLRVVDKNPGNHANLGMIHVAFPNARIIHVRRNPVDTCLSIWATQNGSPAEWANDKAAIVFAYREYLRIMEHWRTVLPRNRLLDVDYEQLVTNTELVSREMISFCGLEWDENCLAPEKNPRAVATPSALQVREPVYTTSVARWRRYEPWLDEFSQLL